VFAELCSLGDGFEAAAHAVERVVVYHLSIWVSKQDGNTKGRREMIASNREDLEEKSEALDEDVEVAFVGLARRYASPSTSCSSSTLALLCSAQ
jgi:hypothetical protein